MKTYEDKKEKTSTSSTSSSCSVRSISSEKRKLKSDCIDVVNCNVKRRHELKRLNVDTDTLRKRPKINSSSQEPIKLQEASYSNDNQIISQSPSSNGTKNDISKCVDFKDKDIKLINVRSNLDHGVKNLSIPKIAKDVKPKAEGQANEKLRPHLLAHRQKMKDLKKERHNKYRDSFERCVLEKCKRIQFSQDYNSNKIFKEPQDPRRRKVSFKIPVKSHDTHQKPVEENIFLLESSKSTTKQKKKGCLENFQVSLNLMKQKSKHLFSDFTCKQAVCEWKGKCHLEHQESNDSSSSEHQTQSFEAQCSSVSYESIPDTDQEMQIVEELHAARVGKTVDLPVVPPPGELSSMEIDLVEDAVHSSAASTASDKHLLIVIDTNILMNHLKFVRILKTTEIPGFDRLVLIIPWVVVQELDRMKAGKLLKYAQHKAIPAVRFINDSLKSQDRKLWGQSIQLASQKLYGFSDENNDDRVLKCCLQYQELFPSSLVILCTDDRNLRNKGLISGVKSLSKEELSTEFLNLSLNTVTCQQPCVSKQQLKTESVNSGLLILLEGIVADLEKSLGTALSSILETEMKIAFGNLWMEMLYLKPPWTLMHLIQCFKKHWLAVFGLIMENNLLLTVESLHDSLCKANSAVDFTTVKFLLQDSQNLLHAFSTRSDYDGVLPQAFAQVNKLLQTFTEELGGLHIPIYHSDNQEITIFSGARLSPPNRHQEIWSILESVWITIYENRILAPNSNYQDIETLYNFLIKHEVNKSVKFTAQELYDCVSHTEYREKLTIGCRQLVEMEHAMQQCNASVYMEAKNRGWSEDMLNDRT
ncbi:Transcriptional protein SWT1 [Myotis davidii]|uniref:Transcriptional protein SWT1 n=1 Tax=Myotis davidii TaxID=225400 RepID=L5LAF3_MYODS|nr:Transcriptional protein SWT1 [Myotis davidii]